MHGKCVIDSVCPILAFMHLFRRIFGLWVRVPLPNVKASPSLCVFFFAVFHSSHFSTGLNSGPRRSQDHETRRWHYLRRLRLYRGRPLFEHHLWYVHSLFNYHVSVWRHTGLFRVRGNFDTPLNSVVDGPILKSFEVGIANTG